jgi:CPA1 family monovalent cation:H+ antiporter
MMTARTRSKSDFYKRFRDVSRQVVQVERRTAIQLRNQRRISDELLRELEREFDLGEAKLSDA